LSFLVTCRFAVVLEHFAQDQLVGVLAERIPKHGSRDQVHVAIGALGLGRAGAIEVPLGEIYKGRKRMGERGFPLGASPISVGSLRFERPLTVDAFGLNIQSPGFAPETRSGPVDPDVHGLDFISLGELHVMLLHNFAQRGAVGRGHLISYYKTPEDKKSRE